MFNRSLGVSVAKYAAISQRVAEALDSKLVLVAPIAYRYQLVSF